MVKPQDILAGQRKIDAETCRTRMKKDAPVGAAGLGSRLGGMLFPINRVAGGIAIANSCR